MGSRGKQRGQSLVEFAIVFPVFMVMLGGVIQFGMIFWGQNSLNQIVRDAGRFAVTQPNCSTDSETAVASAVTGMGSAFAGTLGTITVTMPTADSDAACPATKNTQHVWVYIKVAGTVPIFFPWVPGNGNLSSEATFRMEPVTP